MQYRAKTPINHNGDMIEPGEVLDLSSEQAAQLIELDAVEVVDMPFAKRLNMPVGENS